MAINYSEANLAWDEQCGRDERWLRIHADKTCGECYAFEPCPCGCGYGICHKNEEDFVCSSDKVGDYELFCWEEM